MKRCEKSQKNSYDANICSTEILWTLPVTSLPYASICRRKEKKRGVMKFEYFCCVPIFQKPGVNSVNWLQLVSQLHELQNSTADEMLRSKLGNSFRDVIVRRRKVSRWIRLSTVWKSAVWYSLQKRDTRSRLYP